MDIVWDGTTKAETLKDDVVKIRTELADSAKAADWRCTLKILAKHPEWINVTRLGGSSLYAPLHHGKLKKGCDRLFEVVELGAEGEQASGLGWRDVVGYVMCLLSPNLQNQPRPAGASGDVSGNDRPPIPWILCAAKRHPH